jgi:hypothetical protein
MKKIDIICGICIVLTAIFVIVFTTANAAEMPEATQEATTAPTLEETVAIETEPTETEPPVTEPTEPQETEPPVILYDVPLDEELQLFIIECCEDKGIDPTVVLAMIWKESNFKTGNKGDGGSSHGLMQVQPYWHSGRMKRLGCTDLLDPKQNVLVGIDYLAEQIERYGGDVVKGVVAYNKGHYAGEVTYYGRAVMQKAEEIAATAYVKGENK